MSTDIHSEQKFSIDAFYTKHKKNIQIGLGVLVALVAGYIYYVKYYMPEQEEKALALLYSTQKYFDKDSMDLVLNGDGTNPGAIDIVDEYGSTKAGNLAKYYAGRAYLAKGDYESALEYFKKASFKDEMLAPLTQILIGDCYVQLDQLEEAGKSFSKAAGMRKNNFTSPLALMKAGRVYEKLDQWDDALKVYKRIKKDYAETEIGIQIDKFIYRAEAKTSL